MTLAKFLLNTKHQYNGHFQTEVSGMSFEDALQLCKNLEEETEHQSCFVLEVWTCGNMTIYEKDYWKKGEHQNGDLDRMILGINNS